MIFSVSFGVLTLAILIASVFSWAYEWLVVRRSGSSCSEGESAETVPEMELTEMSQLSPPPSYSSYSGVPIINSQVAIGKSFRMLNVFF